MPLRALGAAAERGDRALAHVVGVERGDERQPAALLLRRRLVGGLGGCGRTCRAAVTATDLARTLVVVRLGDDAGSPGLRRLAGRRGRSCSRRADGRGRGGFALAEALLGFELGLALGFFIGAMAVFFGLAAGVRRLALGLFNALATGAALGFFLGLASLFLFADPCVGKRADACGVLILGQRTQHDARGVAGRGC